MYLLISLQNLVIQINSTESVVIVRDLVLGALLIMMPALFLNISVDTQVIFFTIIHSVIFFVAIYLSENYSKSNWLFQTAIPATLLAVQFVIISSTIIVNGAIQDSMIFSLSVGIGCAVVLYRLFPC